MPRPRLRGRRTRAHIIGVVVSETNSEIRIATDSVTANSRKRRPTMPPMSRMGMNTAMSDRLIDRTVKPTSRTPEQRRLETGHARLDVPRDVLHHDDGVVDDKPGRDGQRHQREIVQAVVQQVHSAEGADERDGHGHARNHASRRQSRRKKNTTRITSTDGDHQGRLHLVQRGPDGGAAVNGEGQLAAAGIEACNCGSRAFTRSTVSMMFAPGLPVYASRRRPACPWEITRRCGCPRPSPCTSATSESRMGAPLR